MAEHERRRFARHSIQLPVSVSTPMRRNRIGMIRDVSASGMLFHSLSRFEIGERVTLMFRIGRTGSTTAHVVRTFSDPNDDNLFRFVTAVRFDAPLLDLPLEDPISEDTLREE
ncbi:MAG: PilZ domain-containing protein [Kofleriaceae bacterium]